MLLVFLFGSLLGIVNWFGIVEANFSEICLPYVFLLLIIATIQLGIFLFFQIEFLMCLLIIATIQLDIFLFFQIELFSLALIFSI
jgi:hypothetical protein